MKAAVTFDSFTHRHLDDWLDWHVDRDEELHAVIKAKMLDLAAEDPKYWLDVGWRALFDWSGCADVIVRADREGE
jgi:hypothetical protein